MGLPDFKKFRKGNSESAALNDGFNDGFDDGLDDGFNDDFGGGFDDDLGGMSDGFDDRDRLNSGFPQEMPQNGDDVPLPAEYSMPAHDNAPEKQRSDREKADLKAGFGALFKAISDRFTGNGKPARSTAVDGSDASFANEYDSAVDEGFAPLSEEMPQTQDNTFGQFRNDEPEDNPPTDSAEREYEQQNDFGSDGYRYSGYPDDAGYRDNSDHIYSGNRDNYDFSQNEYDSISENDSYPEDNSERYGFDDFDAINPENAQSDADVPHSEGSTDGLFAALGAAFAKFRRRLPSFRPKVYVLPEPEYEPEQDGIGTPTLASDIRKILEEQNKSGETEQEYDRMRSYIRSVSTDTRIRPGDIKAPENLGEVRAAESELYDLIDAISNTNEQQRRRIGVYEKPPEEDPYNYRGINDDRQFYTDMDAFSFDMNSRYGFESEHKVDPGRKAAEMEYDRVYNQAISGQYNALDRSGDLSDGFDDDLGDLSDGFDDDLGGMSDGFDGDLGDLNDGFGSGRRYDNSNDNASYREGFADDRARRSSPKKTFARRKRD